MSSTESEKNINLPTTKTNKKSTNMKSANKRSGRPFSEIWKTDMKRGEPRGDGHYSGTCQYCSTHWKRAKPISLKIHLTKCNLAPSEVRKYWKEELYGNDEEDSTDSDTEISKNTSSKRKKNFNKKINKKLRINEPHQSDIRNHVTNTNNELEISVINIIDNALLNAFVCCGIPFKVVENPFFLELLKVLQPLYNPPTRQRLSGSLLEYESGRIENKINHKLDRGENYTLAIDGWSDPQHKSIWGFMILTPNRKEYLYHLEDLSDHHHTAEFLASKTEAIITRIGAEKISAIVSDNGANVAAARSIIHKNHPSIINLRCIAHCFNLLSQDVLKSPFGERIIKLCNILCHFFRSSHIGAALLENAIKEKAIKGGGIKPYVKTRWITMYECTNSIVRLKPAFDHIVENSKSEISNTAVLTILQKRGIFDDIQKLSEILLPIKDAILSLEKNNANLADCYINLLRVAASIKKMDQYDYKGFHTHMVQVFNKRYKEFNDPKYLLTFFLHPEWKGTLVTPFEFDNLIELAGELWKEWGHGKNSTTELYSQIGKYRLGKKPYNKPYSSKHDTPLNWWLLINDGRNQLSRLAVKLFSITPHSASCERIFSSLGWFFGKRRQRLQLNTLQSMAKIHRYSLSHMKTSVGHISGTYNEEELRDLLFEINNESEDMEEDDFDEATINQDMERARELERAINYDHESENDDLTIERSVDLGPWVIIEVGRTPVLTHKSDSSDDDCEDFDPKELANEYRIDMEDNEDTNEDNRNNIDNDEYDENSGNDESNKEDEDNRDDDNRDIESNGDDEDNEDNEDNNKDNEDNSDIGYQN